MKKWFKQQFMVMILYLHQLNAILKYFMPVIPTVLNGWRFNMQTVRKNITVPVPMDKAISDYQNKHGIISWTAAMLELVRKGLESSK
jgi:hypothetical protein